MVPAVGAPESLMVVPEGVVFAAGLAPKSAIKIKIVINHQPDRPSKRNNNNKNNNNIYISLGP